MQNVRRWHLYIGMFTAPTILFFAITGCFQLFNLHESHGDYRPPALIAKLARVHKDQVFALEHDDGDSKPASAAPQASASDAKKSPADDDDDDAVRTSTLVLKWFFLFVALSLVTSTLLGIWMGVSHARRKRLALALFIAGALVPLGLLML